MTKKTSTDTIHKWSKIIWGDTCNLFVSLSIVYLQIGCFHVDERSNCIMLSHAHCELEPPPPRGRDRFAARRCVTRGNLSTSNRPGLNIISVLRGWSVWSSRHYSSYSKRPILRKCTESGVTCEEDHDTHIQGIISFPSPRTAACFFCCCCKSWILLVFKNRFVFWSLHVWGMIQSTVPPSIQISVGRVLCIRMKRMVIAWCAST